VAKLITRRDFIHGSAGAVVVAAVGLPPIQEPKTRVVLIRHPEVVDSASKVNADLVQQMLDEAVMTLMGEQDPVAAFSSLIKPGETVGIKSNNWSYLPTPPELEQAIERRVIEAGVAKENISIADGGVLRDPVFVNATSLINVRPLRTHYLAGISGVMKNYIRFAENFQDWHPNNCGDLGALYFLPAVKGKTRLNILSVLTPQFHSRGPHAFSRRYVWKYNGLLVSKDPVAVDAVGLELIKTKRREELGRAKELPPVPRHVELADSKHNLGTSDLNKIELIRLGWQEDILI